MGRKLLLLLTISSLNIQAQITVTQNDIIGVGDVIYQALDTIVHPTISPGNPGSNQTWDFSYLQAMELDTIEFISPVATPFFSFHPTANLCVDQEGEYLYLEKNNTGLTILGFDSESFVSPIVPLPLSYGLSQSTGPTNAVNTTLPNVFLPDSLSFLITLGQAHTIDSIKVQVNQNTDWDVDAFGDVILPSGTYEALRLKVNQVRVTNYFTYCTDTLFGIASGWYQAPTQLFPSETETYESFQWWTNDPSMKFSLVEMSLDDYGIVENVNFLLSSSISSYEVKNEVKINIFPNPASDFITIDLKDNNSTYAKLLDACGRVIFSTYIDKLSKLDISSISPGIYYLSLDLGKEVFMKKLVVE